MRRAWLRRLLSRQGLSHVISAIALLTLIQVLIISFFCEPQEVVHRLSPDVQKVIEAEWLMAENGNIQPGDSIQSVLDRRKRRILHEITGDDSQTLPKVSAILSLHNFESTQHILESLRNVMTYIPKHIVDDVIVIVSGNKAIKGALPIDGDVIQKHVDNCSICNLIFLNHDYFTNVNLVLRFVRNDLVVSIDGRVQLTDFWLEPMVARFSVHHNLNLFISPHIRLSNEDGSEISVGDYQNHITWDLGVVRSSDDELQHLIETKDPLFINQSVISKEVFLFSRDSVEFFFGIDVYPENHGAEDVELSIKSISCGIEILQSRISVVLLPLINKYFITDNRIRSQEDFFSPSFFIPDDNIRWEFPQIAEFWLDADSEEVYRCTTKASIEDIEPSNVRFARAAEMRKRRKDLDTQKCKYQTFKSMILRRQPRMFDPLPKLTSYGFIRNINGMFAFGSSYVGEIYSKLNKVESRNFQMSQKLQISRNSSQWIGSFSYTNLNIVLKESLCVTSTSDGYLYLSSCEQLNTHQQFVFENNIFSLKRDSSQCIGFHKTTGVTSDLRVMSCETSKGLFKFKFDVQFKPNCLTKMIYEDTLDFEKALEMARQQASLYEN